LRKKQVLDMLPCMAAVTVVSLEGIGSDVSGNEARCETAESFIGLDGEHPVILLFDPMSVLFHPHIRLVEIDSDDPPEGALPCGKLREDVGYRVWVGQLRFTGVSRGRVTPLRNNVEFLELEHGRSILVRGDEARFVQID